MRIQFTDSVAGARFAYRTGEKVILRDDIARGFIKCGQAVRIDEDEVETAVAGPVETTARRTGGSRRRTLKNLGGLLPG